MLFLCALRRVGNSSKEGVPIDGIECLWCADYDKRVYSCISWRQVRHLHGTSTVAA